MTDWSSFLIYVIWLAITGCWLGAVWTDATTTHQHWVGSAWVILFMSIVAAIIEILK